MYSKGQDRPINFKILLAVRGNDTKNTERQEFSSYPAISITTSEVLKWSLEIMEYFIFWINGWTSIQVWQAFLAYMDHKRNFDKWNSKMRRPRQEGGLSFPWNRHGTKSQSTVYEVLENVGIIGSWKIWYNTVTLLKDGRTLSRCYRSVEYCRLCRSWKFVRWRDGSPPSIDWRRALSSFIVVSVSRKHVCEYTVNDSTQISQMYESTCDVQYQIRQAIWLNWW